MQRKQNTSAKTWTIGQQVCHKTCKHIIAKSLEKHVFCNSSWFWGSGGLLEHFGENCAKKVEKCVKQVRGTPSLEAANLDQVGSKIRFARRLFLCLCLASLWGGLLHKFELIVMSFWHHFRSSCSLFAKTVKVQQCILYRPKSLVLKVQGVHDCNIYVISEFYLYCSLDYIVIIPVFCKIFVRSWEPFGCPCAIFSK